ncbi:MAG: glycosyltransferase family 9 protein [Candidatus Binatia bacterium]
MSLFEQPAKRILIVLHGSIGDVTRALPLANLIRRGFPEAFLSWAVEPACFPLVEYYPAVNEIILFDRRRGWRDFVPFLKRIRSRRFDLVLDLQRHLKSGVISFFSGAPDRIGFHRSDCKELNWIFNNAHIPAVGDQVSKLEHYLKFAEYLGVETSPVEWFFRLTADEELGVDKHLAQVGRAYAALFVGSRWVSKQWFPAQIADCARAIQRRHSFDVVLLGSKQDEKAAAEAQAQCGAGVTNLVGQTSLREAIGIISRAKVAIGPDTGLMHISAAVGTPVVSLWGATTPSRNAPYGFGQLAIRGRADCSPCNAKTCPIDRLCMKSIETAEVADKVALALSLDSKTPGSYATRS